MYGDGNDPPLRAFSAQVTTFPLPQSCKRMRIAYPSPAMQGVLGQGSRKVKVH